MHFTRHAVLTVLGNELTLVAEGEKGVCALVNSKNDIAASAAVTAVGTARRNVLFSMEGNGTVTAIACLDINFNIIYKHIFAPYTFVESSPRCLITILTGVPSKPKVSLRQFSM